MKRREKACMKAKLCGGRAHGRYRDERRAVWLEQSIGVGWGTT